MSKKHSHLAEDLKLGSKIKSVDRPLQFCCEYNCCFEIGGLLGYPSSGHPFLCHLPYGTERGSSIIDHRSSIIDLRLRLRLRLLLLFLLLLLLLLLLLHHHHHHHHHHRHYLQENNEGGFLKSSTLQKGLQSA